MYPSALKSLTLAVTTALSITYASAQSYPCTYWPAPCPHETSIRVARDWAVGRRNDRLPQEMEFDAHLRDQTSKIVQRIASQNHWEVYEFNESSLTAPLAANEHNIIDTVPYIKRPPQLYSVSYIFITDRQALEEWRDWYAQFRATLEQRMSGLTKPVSVDNRQQAYMDSAMYYTTLRTKYVQDHQQAYMNDLKSNNEKALKQYNDQINAYQKKSDLFIARFQQMQQEANAGPQQTLKAVQKEETDHNVTFRDKTVILVQFSFNDHQAGSGLVDPTNNKCILPQKKLSVSGVQFAGITHNPLPLERVSANDRGVSSNDYDLGHPTAVGVLLVDGWSTQAEPPYLFYHALYQKNPANLGYKSVKPVTCDHLRSIAVHIEGRDDKVEALMQQLNFEILKSEVVR